MFQSQSKEKVLEKEWKLFLKREDKILKRYGKAKQSFIDQKLKTVVPPGLRETMEAAFYKAFQVVLQNGTGIIEKTYSKEKLETDYKIREYRHQLHATRKNLKAGPKTAGMQTAVNVAGAGIEGAAFGFLGIGLPDIPLFLGVIFRSLYTLCLNYGIDYKEPGEQDLLLGILTQSLYRGEDFLVQDAAINKRLYEAASGEISGEVSGETGGEISTGETGAQHRERTVGDETIREAASSLSGELLYLKFLQGMPIVGVIGGIYDGIYLKRITDYATVKLERRYLIRKMKNEI